MLVRSPLWILLWLLLTTTMSSARQSDATLAATRQLRGTINPQRNGSHLPRLASLRQLGDPDLRPLFVHVKNHAEWQVQVHAILGLAELSSPPPD